MVKRLIFDVDGTLITGVSFTKAIRKTLKQLNLCSNENVQQFINGINSYETIYDNYNRTDYTNHFSKVLGVHLDETFIVTFFDNLKDTVPPKNQSLINKIFELSKLYELVLLTNYFSESQLNRLNNMEIGRYFSMIYGEHKIKPNKEAYIMACGEHKPAECVMIGDDLYLDIQMARENGLKTIFVNSKKIDISNYSGCVIPSVENITPEMVKILRK